MSIADQNVRPVQKSAEGAGCGANVDEDLLVAKPLWGLVPTLRSLRLLFERFPLWLRLSIPLMLLAVELILITPFFEFKAGPMRRVADPILLIGLMVGLAAFFLIAGEKLSSLELPDSRRRFITIWAWSTAHLVSLLIFLAHSALLHDAARQASTSLFDTAIWCLLAAAVAATAVLVSLPSRTLVSCLRQCLPQAIFAIGLACLMAWMTPWIRDFWTSIDGPAIEVVDRLLDWYPGESRVRHASDGMPILGTRRVSLVVTPHCSEIEAFLAFVLLGFSMLAFGGRRMWNAYFLGAFFVGFELLYFVNAYRLYLLVLFGHVLAGFGYSSEACVRMAHSRIGSIALLAIATLILLVGERLSRREWVQARESV